MPGIKLPDVNCQYGAPMGRANHPNRYDPDVDVVALRQSDVRLRLARVYLDSGGYDNGGAYWGSGAPLYRAWNDDVGIELYMRAYTREQAQRKVHETYPRARFYR